MDEVTRQMKRDEVDLLFAENPYRRAGWKEFATIFTLIFLAFATIACWLAAAIWGS